MTGIGIQVRSVDLPLDSVTGFCILGGMELPTTTITEVEPGILGGGTYRIDCTCGERVTYRGQAFTQVEAERHQRWHAQQAC
jgi:hypothetical protein